jgi:NAD-reducing hydrogenase small subunit
MSFLDMDERLIELASKIELVYSPIADVKTFPELVDVTLVEGAISSEHDRDLVREIRERTAVLISFGDCAVTANVPGMRNQFTTAEVMARAYIENADCCKGMPSSGIPKLLPKARPVHELVKVDLFLPGCPPPADAIHNLLTELLEGRVPDPVGHSRFGA